MVAAGHLLSRGCLCLAVAPAVMEEVRMESVMAAEN